MAQQPLENQVFEAVKRNLLDVIPELDPALVSIDKSLCELGCNSIDRAEVVTLTMEDLAISVPVSAFSEVHDIRTLVGVLAQRVR
jgi:polyketide biosynthesis acyl carrier protein